jgi:hypothetical protein
MGTTGAIRLDPCETSVVRICWPASRATTGLWNRNVQNCTFGFEDATSEIGLGGGEVEDLFIKEPFWKPGVRYSALNIGDPK